MTAIPYMLLEFLSHVCNAARMNMSLFFREDVCDHRRVRDWSINDVIDQARTAHTRADGESFFALFFSWLPQFLVAKYQYIGNWKKKPYIQLVHLLERKESVCTNLFVERK